MEDYSLVKDKKIAVLAGGWSAEREISLKSGSTIYNHIDKSKYNAYKVLCVQKFEFKVPMQNIRSKAFRTRVPHSRVFNGL